MQLGNLEASTAWETLRNGSAVRYAVDQYFAWILVAALYVAAGIFLPSLFKLNTFVSVLVQSTAVVTLSLALTFSLIVGEFDLSIVGTLLFAPLVGVYAYQAGAPGIVAILVTVGVGALIGLWNGAVITKIGVPSLVQTLASWWILQGAVLSLTQAQSIVQFPKLYSVIGGGYVGPVRNLIIVTVVIVLAMWYYSTQVVSGRRLFLVGGDPDSAKRMGISIDKYTTHAFVISGILASLAGIVLITRVGVLASGTGSDLLLPAIAAPVISGVALTGGQGKIINVPAGAVLVQLILVITRLGGISSYQFTLVQGLLVFVAVIFNELRKRAVEEA